ncbi:hypothetical protein XELAEV_18024966mg [Xenopus laevis]|uniref:Uncharacterized protein n=1 Tax=Xenopus laevis TaxID=8355 RepID=A0A974D1B3_XENLA|nr:hypothetical protein XELAEV_18024966mg [Xenopus laevis]
MTSIFHRSRHRNERQEDSDMSANEEPLFQQGPGDGSRIKIKVIKNINTYARTKTLAQGFLDMTLLTANASQMKHLLQEGLLFLIYKGFKNIECDDPERRLSDRVHLLNIIVTGLILVITAVNVFITAFWFSPLHSTPEDQNFCGVETTAEC